MVSFVVGLLIFATCASFRPSAGPFISPLTFSAIDRPLDAYEYKSHIHPLSNATSAQLKDWVRTTALRSLEVVRETPVPPASEAEEERDYTQEYNQVRTVVCVRIWFGAPAYTYRRESSTIRSRMSSHVMSSLAFAWPASHLNARFLGFAYNFWPDTNGLLQHPQYPRRPAQVRGAAALAHPAGDVRPVRLAPRKGRPRGEWGRWECKRGRTEAGVRTMPDGGVLLSGCVFRLPTGLPLTKFTPLRLSIPVFPRNLCSTPKRRLALYVSSVSAFLGTYS